MSLWLSGTGVSRGIAIGQVQKLHAGDPEVPEYRIDAASIDSEVLRFMAAQRAAKQQLREVRGRIPLGLPGDIAAFIDTHLLMMDDRSIIEVTIAAIRQQACNAEAALRGARDALVQAFGQIEDAYLRTRCDDVEQVCNRIQRLLIHGNPQPAPRSEIQVPTVIVARDITPADIILLSQQSVVAFVAESGGPLSHAAILARSLGIPAVLGSRHVSRLLREGEQAIVDGGCGHVLAGPEAQALAFYQRKQRQQLRGRQRLQSLREQPAESRDGVPIRLLANVEQADDVQEAADSGAEGVGLYRTEFLFLNRRDLPSEDEQYQAYARVVSAVKGPITIRTLDLGADKPVAGSLGLGAPTSNHPALGLRAIRLCLKDQALFRTQVRALLRASVHGQMKIMLPMISSLAEFRQAATLIGQCRDELSRQGLVTAPVPIGAMIEVPAAAISAPMLARHAAFFSIGTNDLIQYTLALDRTDEEVNYLYDPLHPAVLQLIRISIQAGAHAGVPVAMCGEMAGDPRYTRLLLGLGLTEFSMHPSRVLEVKQVLRQASIVDLRAAVGALVDQMLQGEDCTDALAELLRNDH